MNFFFCILRNELDDSHVEWVSSCERFGVRYKVVDLTRQDWLEEALGEDFDCYLAKPPGSISYFKTLYDERLYVLHYVLGKRIYPTYEEILIYENKKVLAYWLEANNIPHPQTWVFYDRNDALEFVDRCRIPIVAKTSIGGAGSGVEIMTARPRLRMYIGRVFSDKGVTRSFGPNLRKSKKGQRLLNVLKDLPAYYKKIKERYVASRVDPHRWFVILQEYIQCEFEWRAVKIGNSYFAHKKLPVGGMCSGTTKVSWDGPSNELLDFVKHLCEKRGFYSQAVDIFEDRPGHFLVNEMQCFFGSENPHQMIITGTPGRYVHKDGRWVFEEGSFNTNNSFDLRMKHAIDLLRANRL